MDIFLLVMLHNCFVDMSIGAQNGLKRIILGCQYLKRYNVANHT